jgi:deaminated glutathione amidase
LGFVTVEVAVAQFGPGTDKAANLDNIRALVGEAAARGAQVVVAPEFSMYAASKLDRGVVEAAEPLDGSFVGKLSEIASDADVYIVAGIAERVADKDRISNTLVAVAPDGSVAATYRKLHLYDAFGFKESDWVVAAPIEAPQTFAVEGVTFGMQTCYDVRFPEVTRRIVDAGADVLLLPAQWVPGPLKEDHWTTLLRARAIENTIYVAAADQAGPNGAGNSMIIDPMGVVLAALGERTGTASATISADRIAEVRKKNPALELRRFRGFEEI